MIATRRGYALELGFAVLAAGIAMGEGCSGVSQGPSALLRGKRPSRWYEVRPTDRPRGGLGIPEAAGIYERRLAEISLGLDSPPCLWLQRSLRRSGAPVFVLVHGVGGDEQVWREVVPMIEAVQPSAVFVYRWARFADRDILAERLALGISRITACTRAFSGPLVVLAHSAGGVLTALAASRIVVPAAQARPVYLLTVAAPLAGTGQIDSRQDGTPEPGFFFDLGTRILGYPEAAPGVEVLHLRTAAPADPVMAAGMGGHPPNKPGVGVPGAVELDLPYDLGHDDALRFVAMAIASDNYEEYLDLFDHAERLTGKALPTPDAVTSADFATLRSPATRTPVCQLREHVVERGDPLAVPDFGAPPDPRKVTFWDGSALPEGEPDARLYVRCRPCDCSERHAVEPWDTWAAVNRRAYAQLRRARAPYPVAIIPGFPGGGLIARNRVRAGLELLKQGWVAALLLSGGHRRSGRHEARHLLERAWALAEDHEVDVRGRLFIEPCANKSITNLRNSLRMMAAMGLRHGLLVTDSKMSGQALTFHNRLETLVPRDLRCQVGRVSYLLGENPLPRFRNEHTGCQPPLGWRNNPLMFLWPSRPPSVFWVSPVSYVGGEERSALACRGGSDRLVEVEPDDQDPFRSSCLPIEGRSDMDCTTVFRKALKEVRDFFR